MHWSMPVKKLSAFYLNEGQRSALFRPAIIQWIKSNIAANLSSYRLFRSHHALSTSLKRQFLKPVSDAAAVYSFVLTWHKEVRMSTTSITMILTMLS